MDSQRQSDPYQETPYIENKEDLQNKDLQPQNKERQADSSDKNEQNTPQIKPHGEAKITLIEEIDAFEKGFQYATDFLAGSFDTIVNLVRPNEHEAEKHEDKNHTQGEKFESFKKELIEKTSPSTHQHEEGTHQHHHLHADSKSFKPTEESKALAEQIIEGHEGAHHHLSADSQSFKPNTDTKILTEKIIEGLEDSSASLVEKAHEAEKEIEEVHHSHQGDSFTTPSKMMEKRKSEEFWLAEDGPVKDQPQAQKHNENSQEERVPLLDHVIHGYQAVASTIGFVKNLISPAKQAKLQEEGENISGKKKEHQKKEKREVGADITNKTDSNEEQEKGKRKESWSGKIGRKLSEKLHETLNFGAQEDNPKIA